MTAIRGILFDFGNVLSIVDTARFFASLEALCGPGAAARARRLFDETSLPADFETGRLDAEGFHRIVAAHFGQSLDSPGLHRAFVEIFEPIESNRALVRSLAGRYRLGLLSNTNPWHFEATIRTCPVFPLFDAVTLSYEVGAMKPDPAIYRDALRKLALPAESCIFIDDRAEFAEAATALGIHGLTYTGDATLRAELAELGVEVQP